ncbi:hypothetical protein H6G54_29160 [Anabaena cylindrica FACHB-243]|nr:MULTISPECIES: hypothetical protein [Anabaena]MBD2421676.1 hypothetical protein [Anabaena cylindrica FACHB-243]MBY5280425.1 hypothetical protein [Anabaena sp. CCAP 1446/1C]MBY5308156.1 hypothetical protein [Anabaena sp. CCAP 1446/1C]MCM2405422.1 hypothetical protein [Anabaena sp. CCAP 1446/1C]
MMKRKEFRTVNRVLGEQPRIGPFPADQFFPWTAIALITYLICKLTFQTSLLVTGLVTAWGCATWWTLTSNKTWLSKFLTVPRVTRGYKRFYSLIHEPKIITSTQKKISKSRQISTLK